jgi:hypothetical protein
MDPDSVSYDHSLLRDELGSRELYTQEMETTASEVDCLETGSRADRFAHAASRTVFVGPLTFPGPERIDANGIDLRT